MNMRCSTLALLSVSLVACADLTPTILRSGLTPDQLTVLDDAPPPAVPPLAHFRSPGDRIEARARAKRILIAGGVLTSIGAAFLVSGGITYAVPSTCDTQKDWFCDLGQALAGISLMSVGAAGFAVGTIVLGVGGHAALEAAE